MNGANQTVSAGIGAFVTFFLLAMALWLLIRNMNTRLRNIAFREEAEEERIARERGEALVARPGHTPVHGGPPHEGDTVPAAYPPEQPPHP